MGHCMLNCLICFRSPGSKGRCAAIWRSDSKQSFLLGSPFWPRCGKLSWISAASFGPICAVRSALSFLPLPPLRFTILLHGIVTGVAAAAQVTAGWSSGTAPPRNPGNEECTSQEVGRLWRTSGFYKGMRI